MIEPYTFLPIRGISPSVLTAFLDSSGADEKETEGIIDKPLHPGISHTKDEAGAKERAACTMGNSGLPAGNLEKEVNHERDIWEGRS